VNNWRVLVVIGQSGPYGVLFFIGLIGGTILTAAVCISCWSAIRAEARQSKNKKLKK